MTLLATLTDSIGTFTYPAYPEVLAARMGWTVDNGGQGGTGYVNDGGGGVKSAFTARVAALVALAPGVVIVQGGINDTWYPAADITTAVTTTLQGIRTGLPDAVIYAMAPWMRHGAAGTTSFAAIDAAIRAAAAAVGAVYLDWSGWITGTGDADTITGDGNGDVYIGSDGIHPNAAGAGYVGTRLAHAISAPATGLDF